MRDRFPGIDPDWARFDGPAGTQMVDSAINAMADFLKSGANANGHGHFAASAASTGAAGAAAAPPAPPPPPLRGPAARRGSRRHRVRGEHDHPELRADPRVGA